MTPSDSIAQANRALTEAPGGVELPTEVLTEVLTPYGERNNLVGYLTGLRGCDQPTLNPVAALIRTAREQGGR